MSAKPRILVTTGNSRTGAGAVTELLRRDFPVRALVRKDDHRAQRLREAGAEVMVGSFYDIRDLRVALKDVQRVYHSSPHDPGILHSSVLVSLAAEEAGVEVVALMSTWNPHATHPSVTEREHWMANNIYRRIQSFDVIHINPGVFAYMYLLGLPFIQNLGLLALPFGGGLNAPPSSEDIGAVAAGALANPAPYVDRFLRPMGPALISGEDAARALGRVLGRTVRHQAASLSMFTKAGLAQGFPRFEIAQIRRYAEEIRAGAFSQAPNDHVREVAGRAPEGFESIARRYVANPDLIYPGLRAGSLPRTIGLALKMMATRVPDLDRWESTRDYPTIEHGELAHESPVWAEAAAAGRLTIQDPPAVAPSPPLVTA